MLIVVTLLVDETWLVVEPGIREGALFFKDFQGRRHAAPRAPKCRKSVQLLLVSFPFVLLPLCLIISVDSHPHC